MMEFKVSPDKASIQKHDQHIRLFLWSAVLLLIATAIIGIVGVRSIGRAGETVLVVIAVGIVLCVVQAAYTLGAREGVESAKLNTVFLLTSDDLIRQRSGWPDVRIGLAEVKSLYERPGWLVVESVEPRKRISIPNSVEKFQFLRSELLRHGTLIETPHRSPFVALPTIASFLCWSLVFWSKEPRVVKAAACIALLLLAWGSVSVSRLRIGSPKRYFLWATLSTVWMAALWVIYSVLARI